MVVKLCQFRYNTIIMTIHLSKELESNILAVVDSGRFASLDDAMSEAASLLLQRVKEEQAQAKQPASPPAHKPIWERAAELRKSIPEEEWAKLPTDGARQLDHYIYGSPKRPTS
jgi:Arc/MetJ-type ribon-helix-helix transcriptional regulator